MKPLEPDEWTRRLREATEPLPGLLPYRNTRRVGVGADYDGATLEAFLSQRHPQLPHAVWKQAARNGELFLDREPVSHFSMTVRAGQQVIHHYIEQGEPTVAVDIERIFEDECLIALRKPAPLPVHPCGRFNRHSLTFLLQEVMPDTKLRPVHRLDADTTGVILLAKSKEAARGLARQFEKRTVKKVYLARVHRVPVWRETQLTHQVGNDRLQFGTRSVHEETAEAGSQSSQVAECSARVLRYENAHALVRLEPTTGRTHQLRLQLAASGHPIVHDQLYGGVRGVPSGASHGSAATQEETEHLATTIELHAWRLGVLHPVEGKRLDLEARPPRWALPEISGLATE